MRVLAPLIQVYPLLPTDTATLSDFLSGLTPQLSPGHRQRKEKYSGSTLHLFWRELKAFYNYLIDVRDFEIRPVIKWRSMRPTKDTPLPQILTGPERTALVEHAARKSLQDYVLVRLLLESGPRAKEVASLTDSSANSLTLRVSTKVSGGKAVERIVPVNEDVAEYLNRLILQNGPGPLLRNRHGKPMTPAGVSYRVGELMREVGITGAHLGAHTLRHTFGTEYYKATSDLVGLGRILGHLNGNGSVNINTTKQYVTLAASDVDEAFRAFSFGEMPKPVEQLPLLEGVTA